MDDFVKSFQTLIDDLYLPDEKGNYKSSTMDEALNVLYSSQKDIYPLMKTVTESLQDDDALAFLAEVDHCLDYRGETFQFDFDVNPTGRSTDPYVLFVKYGDPELAFVNLNVSATSC